MASRLPDGELCDYTGCTNPAIVARKNQVNDNLEMHICNRHFKHELTKERYVAAAYWTLSPNSHDEAVIDYLAARGRRLAHV